MLTALRRLPTRPAGRPHSVLDLGNPQEVETVKTMFDLCVNKNMGIHQICGYLNERNIPNPNGKPWNKGGVGYILSLTLIKKWERIKLS